MSDVTFNVGVMRPVPVLPLPLDAIPVPLPPAAPEGFALLDIDDPVDPPDALDIEPLLDAVPVPAAAARTVVPTI